MGRLGIIAARGSLPLQLAKAACSKGENPYIIALDGQCDISFDGFESVRLSVGKIGAITEHLKQAKCSKLALVGKFKRPSIADISFDAAGLALLGRLMLTGDDTALRIVADYFAKQEINVIANADYLPHQVLPLHYRAGRSLTPGEIDAVLHAKKVLERLGDLDAGQCVIVQQRRILAIEAAEGTNLMINRAAELIDRSQPDTVFVKMAKSDQDIALDMPVFGLETLKHLSNAGIPAVCLEGERLMLADPLEQITSTADEMGIGICTFPELQGMADG